MEQTNKEPVIEVNQEIVDAVGEEGLIVNRAAFSALMGMAELSGSAGKAVTSALNLSALPITLKASSGEPVNPE